MANNNTNLYFTDSEYSDSQGSYSYPYSDHYGGTFEHSVQGQYQMYHNPQQFQQGLHQDFKPCSYEENQLSSHHENNFLFDVEPHGNLESSFLHFQSNSYSLSSQEGILSPASHQSSSNSSYYGSYCSEISSESCVETHGSKSKKEAKGPGRKRMYTDKERHKRKLESARRSREKRTELDKLVLAHVEAKELIYMRIKNLKRNVEDGLSDLRRRTRHY